MTPEEEKDRNFITALARGLDVLRAFDSGELELSNTDLAERTGLPKPTVSRMTYTLVKLDYLHMDERTGLYRLGPGVLKLGLNFLVSSEIAHRARATMQRVLDGPNPHVSVSLGQRHREEVVYIAVERAREVASLSLGIGASVPLFFSATGRAILMALPEDVRAAAFETADRMLPDEKAMREASWGRAQTEYETKGYLSSYGEWRKDIVGLAVPIFSLDSARGYGLNVGGHAFHVDLEELERNYSQKLVTAGEELSIQI